MPAIMSLLSDLSRSGFQDAGDGARRDVAADSLTDTRADAAHPDIGDPGDPCTAILGLESEPEVDVDRLRSTPASDPERSTGVLRTDDGDRGDERDRAQRSGRREDRAD